MMRLAHCALVQHSQGQLAVNMRKTQYSTINAIYLFNNNRCNTDTASRSRLPTSNLGGGD
jgi:hypothetical protein